MSQTEQETFLRPWKQRTARKPAEKAGSSDVQQWMASADKAYKGMDYAAAVKWYQKAAEAGDALAQYRLARCYARGRGVSRNYAKAVKWYRLSAEQGNAKAKAWLKTLR